MHLDHSKVIREVFIELLIRYSSDSVLIQNLWLELEHNYTQEGRHYHNLEHLNHLLEQLHEVKAELEDWDIVLFSLFYHDVIYNTLKSDNEEKSAELSEKRLKQISIAPEAIARCKKHILATKLHSVDPDPDTNFFIDADLSILGSSWDKYSEYAKNIRKEYAYCPDLIYNAGRKKVLKHFLKMERIFKTEHFFNKYELQARKNLQGELDLL